MCSCAAKCSFAAKFGLDIFNLQLNVVLQLEYAAKCKFAAKYRLVSWHCNALTDGLWWLRKQRNELKSWPRSAHHSAGMRGQHRRIEVTLGPLRIRANYEYFSVLFVWSWSPVTVLLEWDERAAPAALPLNGNSCFYSVNRRLNHVV